LNEGETIVRYGAGYLNGHKIRVTRRHQTYRGRYVGSGTVSVMLVIIIGFAILGALNSGDAPLFGLVVGGFVGYFAAAWVGAIISLLTG
jgi:hypothetical protein